MTKILLWIALVIHFATMIELFIDAQSKLIPIGIVTMTVIYLCAAVSDCFGSDIKRAIRRRRARRERERNGVFPL